MQHTHSINERERVGVGRNVPLGEYNREEEGDDEDDEDDDDEDEESDTDFIMVRLRC
jgi:hypothetical protein